jgi:hypothetical protein
LAANRATIAVLLEESRAVVPDALRLSESESTTERERLTRHGVLAATTTTQQE